MDNINTHKPASLYKRYPANEARRIIKRFDIHYTSKHGSWLDMAEIELNVMSRQCLSIRIDNIDPFIENSLLENPTGRTRIAGLDWFLSSF